MKSLKTRQLLPALLASAVTLVAGAPAFAHHSPAAFNTEVETTLTGTVAEYSFRNPHVYITLDVKKPDGNTVSVEVEAGAGAVLSPLGFTRDAIKVGDVVTVHGNPGRRTPDELLLGRELYKEDGSYFPLNISSRSIYSESEATATSVEGTWFPPRASFFGFLGSANSLPVTEAGRAAMANSSSVPTPQKDCVPIGEPALMVYPVAITIDVLDDRVDMKIDWLDSQRTIWLDGREHPPAAETSLHGHSVGHFDGKVLVVDTTNFSPNPIGFSMALPSGTGKHLVERFEVSADGKGMLYSVTMEDPQYLTSAVDWSGSWEYRPEMQHSNETCDLDAARRFLDD